MLAALSANSAENAASILSRALDEDGTAGAGMTRVKLDVAQAAAALWSGPGDATRRSGA